MFNALCARGWVRVCVLSWFLWLCPPFWNTMFSFLEMAILMQTLMDDCSLCLQAQTETKTSTDSSSLVHGERKSALARRDSCFSLYMAKETWQGRHRNVYWISSSKIEWLLMVDRFMCDIRYVSMVNQWWIPEWQLNKVWYLGAVVYMATASSTRMAMLLDIGLIRGQITFPRSQWATRYGQLYVPIWAPWTNYMMS